jgi:uncharacterized protein YbjT (DUF2867 family)
MYDVAEVAVRSVRIPSARNRTIVFSGPQGVTQREAVKVFEEATGKPLNVTAVPQQALEEQWKTSDNPFQKTFAGLMLGISKLDAEPMPLSDEYAFEMATVGDYAKKMTQSS